ncbi:serine/threonine-protein kinase [Iningainema tapete]|uniref:Serine/threonine protein kinase n=1 Tax=Iningainema tapete BLCC-T55 TaxID=2748662 RepID=A0A8J6XA88_9CYAN|nr:serine/threonine-protein kinase [Iningainema tapete]MBD2770559.1 serine/threonine protein kinase [Iningainema tapete BLCC-T55]
MICCLNPDCPSPLNSHGNNCSTCGNPLVPLLRNRFRVIGVLSSEGGFGRTYLASDTDKLNERCVIKQLAPKFQGNWVLSKAIELFKKEATQLQKLGEHPQIPTLHAFFEQDNYLYLVQQFIDGQNLLKELQQKKVYSSKEIVELLQSLLPVLKFIHERGIIHRDIKPQNIMRRTPQPPLKKGAKSSRFSKEVDSDLVLIDFGSAKQLTAKVQMKTGTTIGSHGYSPIEQIRDGAAYPASDLFSLGATCFHLLSGVSPYHLWMENGYGWVGSWWQYLSNPVDNELAQILDKLLKKSIQHRYQSADEVMRDLTSLPQLPISVVSTISSTVVPSTLPPSLSRRVNVKNFILLGSAIALLGTGEYWYQQRHLKQVTSQATPIKNSPISFSSKFPLEEFSLANTIKGRNLPVSIAISPDAKTIVSGNDNTIKLWSLVTGQEICTFNGHDSRINVLAISSNGQTLVSGSEDKTIKLWNLGTGQEIRSLREISPRFHAFALSKDGKVLATGNDDHTIKLWNLTTGQVRTLFGHSFAVHSVAITPDGKTLASGSFDQTIRLWNLTTGQHIRTLTGHSDKVSFVTVSSNGQILASASFDKTIKLWNLATGELLNTLIGHSDKVTSIAISPDGKTLASGSSDQTIKLWDLATGKLIRTLTGHSYPVQSISFSPDGFTLISSSEDHTVKIWHLSL